MARRAAPAVTTEYFGVDAKPSVYDTEQWWVAEPEHAWTRVMSTVRAIAAQQSWRSDQRLKCVRLYGNRDIAGLSASKYAQVSARRSADRLTLNVCKAVVDTAAAKIAKNRPKPLFLTSGGDASLQDRAKKLTKFCAGLFEKTNAYAVGQQVFVDACIVDTGVVKVSDDGEDISVERVFVDELYIDEVEAIYGNPRQIHQRRVMHVDDLFAMFRDDAEKLRAIRGAVRHGSNHVEVTESWHLRSSKTSDDGVRMMCIDGATLVHEPYEHEQLPFFSMYWTPPFRGFLGQSLIEEIIGIQIDINKTLRVIQDAQTLVAVPRVYFDSASAGSVKPIDNSIGGHYTYTGRPPIISTSNAMPQEIYSHLENMFRKAFEITGVSQMSATGRKPAGLDAAVALREYQDIETERFVLVGQRYERLFMSVAKYMIALMRARGGSSTVKVKDGKYVDTLDWKDVDIAEEQYSMQVFPVSLLPSTPAGQLQTVRELVKDGFIPDRAQAMALLDYPDLEEFQSLQTASLRNIRRIIERILEDGEFQPPDRYIDVALARKEAQAAYERGCAQGRPRERLDDLDTWMRQLDELEDAMQPTPSNMVPMGQGVAPPMVPQPAPPSYGEPTG